MKKLLGYLVIAIMGFTACEGPAGPPGRDGYDGRDATSTEWFVNDYDVYSNQWEAGTEEGDGYFFHYFEYEVRIPELTEFVFDKGFVGCYLVQEINHNGRNILVQRPLPYTIYGNDNGVDYSENYSFETRVGYIKFIAKYSDFSEIQPLTCTFHVTMMW